MAEKASISKGGQLVDQRYARVMTIVGEQMGIPVDYLSVGPDADGLVRVEIPKFSDEPRDLTSFWKTVQDALAIPTPKKDSVPEGQLFSPAHEARMRELAREVHTQRVEALRRQING